MSKRLATAVLWGLVLLPASAGARPVVRTFDLAAGKEEFVRAFVKAAGSDDPSVATAELLSSNEVLITAIKPGRALLLLIGEGSVDAVRLRVAPPGGKPTEVHATEEQREAARKACPGLKEEGTAQERTLSASVPSPACRAALRTLLDADEYSTQRLELSFAPEALLDQLAQIRAALKAAGLGSVQVSYTGMAAVLTGKVTEAQRLEVMKVLYAQSVGKVLFDDQLELLPEPKSAASAEPSPAPDAGSKRW